MQLTQRLDERATCITRAGRGPLLCSRHQRLMRSASRTPAQRVRQVRTRVKLVGSVNMRCARPLLSRPRSPDSSAPCTLPASSWEVASPAKKRRVFAVMSAGCSGRMPSSSASPLTAAAGQHQPGGEHGANNQPPCTASPTLAHVLCTLLHTHLGRRARHGGHAYAPLAHSCTRHGCGRLRPNTPRHARWARGTGQGRAAAVGWRGARGCAQQQEQEQQQQWRTPSSHAREQ